MLVICEDSSARCLADAAAQSALSESEYWDAHVMAHVVPFAEPGDALDAMLNAFQHGVVDSKKRKHKKGAAKAKHVGFHNASHARDDDDDMLSLLEIFRKL